MRIFAMAVGSNGQDNRGSAEPRKDILPCLPSLSAYFWVVRNYLNTRWKQNDDKEHEYQYLGGFAAENSRKLASGILSALESDR
jgi:hypothetical protein